MKNRKGEEDKNTKIPIDPKLNIEKILEYLHTVDNKKYQQGIVKTLDRESATLTSDYFYG
ncbi:MAG: hypothetical protein AMS17_04260 [Spirochaetes bacterium DG_61]|jgi:hypothetical protein|nr:MAG: hypothetical protein AMS17_04260 [Spirochaetes bacterium DG_61]